jgi:RNA polymerase sigma factor (sigma-70 family)
MNPKAMNRIIQEATKNELLPLEKLDELLVDNETFDKTVMKLNRQLNGTVRIEVPQLPQKKGYPKVALSGKEGSHEMNESLYGLYRNELKSRTWMDREEEYRFAKRMEFFKSRLVWAVHHGGLPRAKATYFLENTSCLPSPSGLNLGPLCQHFKSCPKGKRGLVHTSCQTYNKCRSVFVERNLHLVVIVTLPYRTYGVPLMDLIQEGNAALIRAVEKFDWRKGVRLQTYAELWIKQAVERTINANKNIVRVPTYMQQKMRRFRREGKLTTEKEQLSSGEVSEVFKLPKKIAQHLLETDRNHVSLNAPYTGDATLSLADLLEAEPVETIPQDELETIKKTLIEAMESLTEQEKVILKHRYGLDGADFKTIDELGEMMNLSREWVRQIQIRSLQKLQKHSLLKRLKPSIE